MVGCFTNSTHDSVSYQIKKGRKGEEQDAEILISPFEDDHNLEEDVRNYPKAKICFYSASICITLLILFFAMDTTYYLTNTEHQTMLTSSHFPLQGVKSVFITTEETSLKSCSDNETCHSFLDIIEQKHDGSKYNFVIGERGELYIGAGFKHLINGDKNALYVKLLTSGKFNSSDENLKMCSRLSEIINHGILCDKISPKYVIKEKGKICNIFEFGKNKSYHIHDPDHEVKFMHGNVGWTVCGNFSTTKNLEKTRVISLESLPEKSCLPLQLVNEIMVELDNTSSISCFDNSSCLQSFEEHHDGLNYNFIIDHSLNVYVGLGLNCKSDDVTDNILKIKILNRRNSLPDYKYLQILEEGIACKKISEHFSVKVNCNIDSQGQNKPCNVNYQYYNSLERIKSLLGMVIGYTNSYYNITSEHGRGIVPWHSRIQLCHKAIPDKPDSSYEVYVESVSDIDTDYDGY